MTILSPQQLFGTPAHVITFERKFGTISDSPAGIEVKDDAALNRIMKAKKDIGIDVVARASQQGCEIYNNGLVTQARGDRYEIESAKEGDVMTAQECGINSDHPCLYLLLAKGEMSLGIEESGGACAKVAYFVRVTKESAGPARTQTLARRKVDAAEQALRLARVDELARPDAVSRAQAAVAAAKKELAEAY